MKAREDSKVKVKPVRAPKKLKKTIKNTYTLGKNVEKVSKFLLRTVKLGKTIKSRRIS